MTNFLFNGINVEYDIIGSRHVSIYVDLNKNPVMLNRAFLFSGMHEMMLTYPAIESWTHRIQNNVMTIRVVGDLNIKENK